MNYNRKLTEANDKIDYLLQMIDIYRRSDEIKQLELQFKLSDNYKLELEMLSMEKEIKMKQIESETKIALKNIELNIQRELTKYMAMKKGYELTHVIDNVKKCDIY